MKTLSNIDCLEKAEQFELCPYLMSQKNLHIFAVHWSGPGVTGWAGVTDGADEKNPRKRNYFQIQQKLGHK